MTMYVHICRWGTYMCICVRVCARARACVLTHVPPHVFTYMCMEQLKNVPLGRRLLINTFSVLTQMVEPVSLLQLTGAHQWYLNPKP